MIKILGYDITIRWYYNDVIEMLPSILTMIIVFNTEVSMSGTCDL